MKLSAMTPELRAEVLADRRQRALARGRAKSALYRQRHPGYNGKNGAAHRARLAARGCQAQAI